MHNRLNRDFCFDASGMGRAELVGAVKSAVKRIVEANGGSTFKVGSCFTGRVEVRPFDSNHYSETFFEGGAYLLTWNISSKPVDLYGF